MATSVLVAKSRILAIVKAALEPRKVSVTNGPVRSPAASWAMLGAVTYVESEWGAIGARKRTETYDVAVTVNVQFRGGDAADVEGAVVGHVDALEDALRADPSLSGLTALGVALIPRTLKSQPITDAYECQWEGVVRVSGVRI